MLVREITDYLEQQFPLSYQEDYDNCGLITGQKNAVIRGVLITLDVTPEILKEAMDNDCNMVIAHHPLIFKGIRRITGEDEIQEMLITSIKNDIAVYAIHTNLDNSAEGLNNYIAARLGLLNIRILSPRPGLLSKLATFCPEDHADAVRKAVFEAGAGHIGRYDSCSYNTKGEGTFRALEGADPYTGKINEFHVEKEVRIEVIFPRSLQSRIIQAMLRAHPYEEVAFDIYPLENTFSGAGSGVTGELAEPVKASVFLQKVKEILSVPYLRHNHIRESKIHKIAICTGSGSFLINDAMKAGADLFLTSDLKYHDFFGTGSMILADAGHYETEHLAKDLIHAILIKKFPNFAFLVSKTITNPLNYF